MPIYEYQCLKCGAHTEAMQKIADKPLTKCEKCGGKLEKQWSLSGFQFKGEGWYVTDYAGKKDAAKEEVKTTAQSETSEASESKEDKTTDNKEKKAETKKETKKEKKKSKKEPAAPSA